MEARRDWMYRVGRASLLSGLMLPALLPAASAPDWRPDKRVEVVVPSGAGGGNDRLVRIIQKTVQERKLAEAVITIVNKPGAGQVVGIAYLNQQPPDGHHIGIASVSFMTNYIMGRSPTGPNELTPLALLFAEYVGFAVKPDSKIKTGKELLAVLKADAGSISASMSGGGAGNHNHLALAIVTTAVGGDIRKLKAVAYPSGKDAMMALLGGHVDLAVAPAATLLPQIQTGQLRMIAITAPRRMEGAFAQVPTWRELGADAVVSNWRAIIAPKGLAPPAIAYWEQVLARVVETEDWKKMLEEDVVTSQFLKSLETRSYLNAQHDELKAVLSGLGMAKP